MEALARGVQLSAGSPATDAHASNVGATSPRRPAAGEDLARRPAGVWAVEGQPVAERLPASSTARTLEAPQSVVPDVPP
ncbi:hypothetical protein GCM10027569_65270 [Flindersiella endophytica]